jgi:hypothetical protein
MKFLTIATFKDSFSTLPKDEKIKQSVAAIEYIIALKKKMGDNFHFYGTVGWDKTVSIGEYSSIEEYYQSLQSPSALEGFTNIKSYALIEADEKFLNAYLKQLKTAK